MHLSSLMLSFSEWSWGMLDILFHIIGINGLHNSLPKQLLWRQCGWAKHPMVAIIPFSIYLSFWLFKKKIILYSVEVLSATCLVFIIVRAGSVRDNWMDSKPPRNGTWQELIHHFHFRVLQGRSSIKKVIKACRATWVFGRSALNYQ